MVISHHQIRPSIRHTGMTATTIHLVIIYTSYLFRKSQISQCWRLGMLKF